MRSARGPSSSRRHTGSEPRARTSSTSPSVRSLATTLPAAPPVSFGEGSRARSSRCEAADRSNNWVSVNFTGSSIRLATTIAAATTEAPHWRRSRRGRIQPDSVPGRGHHTTALSWTHCQSFLDNIIAGFQPNLSLNDRRNDDRTAASLTAAGRVFLDHARLVLLQVETAGEAARRVAQPVSVLA